MFKEEKKKREREREKGKKRDEKKVRDDSSYNSQLFVSNYIFICCQEGFDPMAEIEISTIRDYVFKFPIFSSRSLNLFLP